MKIFTSRFTVWMLIHAKEKQLKRQVNLLLTLFRIILLRRLAMLPARRWFLFIKN